MLTKDMHEDAHSNTVSNRTKLEIKMSIKIGKYLYIHTMECYIVITACNNVDDFHKRQVE